MTSRGTPTTPTTSIQKVEMKIVGPASTSDLGVDSQECPACPHDQVMDPRFVTQYKIHINVKVCVSGDNPKREAARPSFKTAPKAQRQQLPGGDTMKVLFCHRSLLLYQPHCGLSFSFCAEGRQRGHHAKGSTRTSKGSIMQIHLS